MFRLRKGWFDRYSSASALSDFPSHEEFMHSIEKEVQNAIEEGNHTNATVQDVKLVLEKTQYEDLKRTVLLTQEETKWTYSGNNNNALEKNEGKGKGLVLEPFLVFHSTQDVSKVNGILKHGYLMPGEQHPTQLWSLKMQNGNLFGDGIYCSPYFDVARWYSFVDYHQSVQLIVNVLVPGRVFSYNYNNNKEPNNNSIWRSGEGGPTGPFPPEGDDSGWKSPGYVGSTKESVPIAHDKRNRNTGSQKGGGVSAAKIKWKRHGPYHTIWSGDDDFNVYVCGCKDRIVPVALVTVHLTPNSDAAFDMAERRNFLKNHRVPYSTIPMHHIRLQGGQDHLWLVKPAPSPQLRRYLLKPLVNSGDQDKKDEEEDKRDAAGSSNFDYATPFVLLMSCMSGQYCWDKQEGGALCKRSKIASKDLWNDIPRLQERSLWYNQNATTPDEFMQKLGDFGGGSSGDDDAGATPPLNRKDTKTLEWLFGGDPRSDGHCKKLVKDVRALCHALIQDHGGLLPSNLFTLASLPGCSQEVVGDFWTLANSIPQWSERFVPLDKAVQFEHYYVGSESLFGQHAVVTRLQDYVASWRSEDSRHNVALCQRTGKLQLKALSSSEALLQIHHEGVSNAGGNSNKESEDIFIEPLQQLVDHLTSDRRSSDGHEHRVYIIYLMLRTRPRDMNKWQKLVEEWKLYVGVLRIMVKLAIFDDAPVRDACALKSFLNTLPSESPDYFSRIRNPTEWEECLQTWLDEVEHEVVRRHQSDTITLAVSYPYGISGEGFLPSGNCAAGLQPTWEVKPVAGQPLLFKGMAPPFMTQEGSYFATTTKVLPLDAHKNEHKNQHDKNLVDFSRAVFCLLCTYQGYMFSSQERMHAYGQDVEALSRHLLEWIEASGDREAPSVVKGLKYKLSGFLTSMETFGGVTFQGKWFTALREMKFGKNVARRVKKVFDLTQICQQVPWQLRPRVAEASDALSCCDRSGILIRVRTSAACEIEPWLVHVDYVSQDTDGSTLAMVAAAEKGDKIRDSRGVVVTDVLPTGCVAGDEILKLYLGYVFTKIPYLYMPAQYPALLVNALTQCVEAAFTICIRMQDRERLANSSVMEDYLKGRVRESIKMAMSLVEAVQDAMSTDEYRLLIENLQKEDNVEALLTTANNIQSVNQVLATLLLPQAAELMSMPTKWPRLCFALLAEAVSRNCRAKVRSGKKTPEQLVDKALLIRTPSDTIDYKVRIKQSSQTTNNFMAHSFTNCSPFRTVGVLFFVEFIHQQKSNEEIIDSFLHNENTTMGGFLRNNLPGSGGYVTQLALYLQGLCHLKGKDRQAIRFENPRAIFDEAVQERVDHYKIQRAKAERYGSRRAMRKAVRLAKAEPYKRYHTFPLRLFTEEEVERLNKCRPVDDQLSVLPTGLLVHHCCYPNCPDFMKNFQTEKDKKNGTRYGIFHHLWHDYYLDRRVASWHVTSKKLFNSCSSENHFCTEMSKVFAKGPCGESMVDAARIQYKQYLELFSSS